MKRFWLVCAWLLTTGFLSAQEVEVHADEKKIGKEDSLTVKVTVEGQDPGVAFSTKDFEIQEDERYSQAQIFNGQFKKSTHYRFSLFPRQTGTLTFSVVCGPVQKGPFTVEVVDGRLKKAPAPDPIEEMFRAPMGGGRGAIGDDEVLLRNEPTSTTVYNGQMFFLDKVLYLRTQVQVPELVKDDDNSGFTAEMVPDHGIPNSTVVLNGQPYTRVVLRRKAMFSLLSGNATIKGWTLRFRKGGGFFSGPARDISAPDLSMTVLPLPDKGKPPSFRGAVGEFTLEARLSPRSVKTHDGATLTYSISGRGQARTLTMPGLPVSDPDIQTRRSRTDDRFKLGSGGWEGSLTTEYLLIPNREKNYPIPPVTWSFFSPSRGTYVTLTTPPLTLSATRTPGSVEEPVRKDSNRQVETLRDDIQYLRLDLPSRSPWNALWVSIYLSHGLGFILILGFLTWILVRWNRGRSPEAKRLLLVRDSMSALERIPKGLPTQELAKGTEDILRDFLHGAYGVSAGIPLSALDGELTPHLDESSRAGYITLIRTCQSMRYRGDEMNNPDELRSLSMAWLKGRGVRSSTGPKLPIFALFAVMLTATLYPSGEAPAFKAASDFYAQGQFLQAYQIFEDQIGKHGPDADLLYQRGCAATRLWGDVAVTQRTGYLAQALRDFNHSLALQNQADVRHNLAYLQSRVGDQITPAEPSLFSMVFFFHYHLLSATHLLLIGGVLWLFGGVGTWLFLLRPRWFSGYRKMLLAYFFALPLVFTFSGALKQSRLHPSRLGWIRVDAVDLHSGPVPSTPVLLVLHEGTAIRPLREVEGYAEVRLADGRLGWLPKEAILR